MKFDKNKLTEEEKKSLNIKSKLFIFKDVFGGE